MPELEQAGDPSRVRQALSGFEVGVPGALPLAVFEGWEALIF